jgi:hypothetical protein
MRRWIYLITVHTLDALARRLDLIKERADAYRDGE